MKKRITKQLENIAGQLPLIMRHTSERHFVKGSELIADDRPDIRGVKVIPDAIYVDRLPVQIAINHKRALKKLFKKFKGDGVRAYIDAVRIHQLEKQKQIQ